MTTLQSGQTAPSASELAANGGDASADLPVRDRLCRGAIAHFGRFGFDQSMLEMSIADDVDVQTLTELFGSIEGLRTACDEYVTSSIGTAKAEALSLHDPAPWIHELTQIDSFPAALTYLARSLQSGDEFGRALMQQLTDDAYAYLASAVLAGTIKPSQDPRARARFLVMTVGGGFLLYLQMHSTPTDMNAVLRDFARDMIVPALELYSQGVLADGETYTAYLQSRRTAERPYRNQPSTDEMKSDVTDVVDDCPPVVVGVDGSHAALNAAQWAVTEAISRGTRVRLVYAESPAERGSTVDGRATHALDAAYAAVTADAPTVEVQTACLMGSAEQVLIEESKNASMICIGAGGRSGAPLGSLATALGQHAQCSVAIIRGCLDQRTGVISVVLDDASDNDAVVHQAMKEGRMRHATVRQIDRRVNSWVRRFPDVHVETVAAGCGPHGGHSPEPTLPQLAVVGRADAQRIGELVSPNCHPIVGYPNCSVLLVGGR